MCFSAPNKTPHLSHEVQSGRGRMWRRPTTRRENVALTPTFVFMIFPKRDRHPPFGTPLRTGRRDARKCPEIVKYPGEYTSPLSGIRRAAHEAISRATTWVIKAATLITRSEKRLRPSEGARRNLLWGGVFFRRPWAPGKCQLVHARENGILLSIASGGEANEGGL